MTWHLTESSKVLSWHDINGIKTWLECKHNNVETFNIFSERMRERGYERTGEQFHLKVKKLWQQDINVCNAI